MRYLFCPHSGVLKHKDPTESIELTEKITQIGRRVIDKDFIEIIDHEIEDATSKQDLLEKIEIQKQAIYDELAQLDKDVPRLLEDIIEFINFIPHSSKLEKINKKKELRQKLKDL